MTTNEKEQKKKRCYKQSKGMKGSTSNHSMKSKGMGCAGNLVISVGRNSDGELGEDEGQNRDKLSVLEWSRELDVKGIINCAEYAMSVMVGPRKGLIGKHGRDRMYVCGSNWNGRIGLGDKEKQKTIVCHPHFEMSVVQFVSHGICAEHIFVVCDAKPNQKELKNDNNNNDQQQQIWCSGQNNYGQLGLGHCSKWSEPIKTPRMNKVAFKNEYKKNPKFKIVDISGGYSHTLFLTVFGEVYSCGNNDYFELGFGDKYNEYEKIRKPTKINFEFDSSKKKNKSNKTDPKRKNDSFVSAVAVQIECGWKHSLVLDSNGKIWSFGYNDFGQLGFEEEYKKRMNPTNKPMKIPYFSRNRIKVVKISSGSNHSAVLDEFGRIYVWGNGGISECI